VIEHGSTWSFCDLLPLTVAHELALIRYADVPVGRWQSALQDYDHLQAHVGKAQFLKHRSTLALLSVSSLLGV